MQTDLGTRPPQKLLSAVETLRQLLHAMKAESDSIEQPEGGETIRGGLWSENEPMKCIASALSDVEEFLAGTEPTANMVPDLKLQVSRTSPDNSGITPPALALGGGGSGTQKGKKQKPARSPRGASFDDLESGLAVADDVSWSTAFQEGAVTADVAEWLNKNYAAEYHRGTTGFDVRLHRSGSVASLGSPESGDQQGQTSPRLKIVVEDESPITAPATTYRRSSQRPHPAFCNPKRLKQALNQYRIPLIEDINDPDFDIFKHFEVFGSDVFTIIGMNIMLQYNFIWSLQINLRKLHKFLQTMQSAYFDRNPYHNACHAADVLQTTNVYLCSRDVKENFSDVELLAVLFAALAHDVGHVGISNAFLIASRHPIARLHNDRSPLEALHVMMAFEILERDDCNFLADSNTFTRAHFDDFRGLVIHAIFGTDMKFHSELTSTAKDILEDGHIDDDEVRDLFRTIVHAADLSNPMKPLPIYLQWADRVLAEFWQQGDEERRKGMPISMMCDRDAANVAKSQLGFINFIVKPFMLELQSILPEVWMRRLEDNARYMETLSGADESERISSISKLAAARWEDPGESPSSYHTTLYRLLQRNYSGGSFRMPHRHPSLDGQRPTPPPQAASLTPVPVPLSRAQQAEDGLNSLITLQRTIIDKLLDAYQRGASNEKSAVYFEDEFPPLAVLDDVALGRLAKRWVTAAFDAQSAVNFGSGSIGKDKIEFINGALVNHVLSTERQSQRLPKDEITPIEMEFILGSEHSCLQLTLLLARSSSTPSSSPDPTATATASLTKAWVDAFELARRPSTKEHGQQTDSHGALSGQLGKQPIISSLVTGTGTSPISSVFPIPTALTPTPTRKGVLSPSAPLVELHEGGDRSRGNSVNPTSLTSVSLGMSRTQDPISTMTNNSFALKSWTQSPGSLDGSCSDLTKHYLERTRAAGDSRPTLESMHSRFLLEVRKQTLPPLRSQSVEPPHGAERGTAVPFSSTPPL